MSSIPEQADEAAPFSHAERKAYIDVATNMADEQGMVTVSAKTLLRLLALAGTLTLHQRREKGFRELATAWCSPGTQDDYQDAGTELTAILDDPHYGDPAYHESEMEHDGQGWRTPYPSRVNSPSPDRTDQVQ